MITGFGRTGKMWGVDHDGVVPDILTVGKGVGGGFPLSGLLSTDALTAAPPFSNPSGSSSSYGGNPLASAAGLASLEIITRENLVENSERVGRAMLGRLLSMQEKHRVIGDARGKGLLLGLELVKDRKTKELVSRDQTKALFQECLRRGLVAMSYSPIIRINPPLNIDEATALEGLDILDEAIGAVFPSPSPPGRGKG
jgi:4-aminobutyrate aminotransferase-like enzyme